MAYCLAIDAGSKVGFDTMFGLRPLAGLALSMPCRESAGTAGATGTASGKLIYLSLVKNSPGGCLCNCRKDLEPGLHISRLGREDFAQFFRLARTMTAFVRIKQVISFLALLVQSK